MITITMIFIIITTAIITTLFFLQIVFHFFVIEVFIFILINEQLNLFIILRYQFMLF